MNKIAATDQAHCHKIYLGDLEVGHMGRHAGTFFSMNEKTSSHIEVSSPQNRYSGFWQLGILAGTAISTNNQMRSDVYGAIPQNIYSGFWQVGTLAGTQAQLF